MTDHKTSNVNVTWVLNDSSTPRTFPCPICASRLELRRSRANKPYCVCNACGIQIFFRGKAGIARLNAFVRRDHPTNVIASTASESVAAFAKIEQLRVQKHELEEKQPLIFPDHALNDAIAAIDRQIAQISEVIRALADRSE